MATKATQPLLRPRALLVPRRPPSAQRPGVVCGQQASLRGARARAGARVRRGVRPRLERISPHFRADARPSGGSLFRIYRDTRFSKDKSPYKTNVGIHFRHERAKDAHAPGYYLHIGPGEVFAGGGIWHPDTAGRDGHPRGDRRRSRALAARDAYGLVRKAARARRRLAQARPTLGRRAASVRGRPAAEGLLRLGHLERGRRRRSGLRRRVRPHLPRRRAPDAVPLRGARRPVLSGAGSSTAESRGAQASARAGACPASRSARCRPARFSGGMWQR